MPVLLGVGRLSLVRDAAVIGAPALGASSVPTILVAPVVSGNRQVGQLLSTTNGTWANTPTGYTYQWKRDGSNISGATASTYTLVELDAGTLITCAVTASNGAGNSSPQGSNSLAIDVYIVFLAHIEDASDLTTYSGGVWNSVSFGVAAANRRLILAMTARNTVGNFTVSSCSIGGVAAASKMAAIWPATNNQQVTEMWGVDLAAGTSGNISITWSGAESRCGGALYAIYGADSGTPYSVANCASAGLLASPIFGVEAVQGSVGIGYGFVNGPSATWNAYTKDFDATVEATLTHSGVHFSMPSGGSVIPLQVTWPSGNSEIAFAATWKHANADTSADQIILPDAGRTWFNTPSTILIGGNIYAGGIKTDGSVVVGRKGATPVVLKATMEQDDHDNPSFLRRSSDGKIIVNYSKHAAVNNYYNRISSNADDMTAFAAETDIGSSFGVLSWSYSNIVEITDGIFNFFRGNTGSAYDQNYSKSTDNGATWSAKVEWFAGPARPYYHIGKNGSNRFDLICNEDNPDTRTTNNSIYHFYYDAGTWKKTDGTGIGSPPFTVSQFTKIWDSSSNGNVAAWSWGMGLSGGVLTAVFAVFNSTTDHRYHCATLSGTTWTDEEVCTGGGTVYPSAGSEDFYSGGICIDPDNAGVIYCSRPGTASGTGNGIHQIFRGVRTGPGAWTMTQLTFSPIKCFRPQKLAGSSYVTYETGVYTNYNSYSTLIASKKVA